MGAGRDILAVALVAGVFSGCAADPPRLSLEDACAHAARVDRARRAACFGFTPMSDEPTLIERGTTACTRYWGAPGSRVDASYWEKCATSQEGNCASSSFCSSYPFGTRSAGERCYSFAQCSSLWCFGVRVLDQTGKRNRRATQCGTCAAPLAEGASCNVESDFCTPGQPGTSCFRGVCRVRGNQGAACDSWDDCNTPWVCTSAGTCGAVVPEGGSCAGSTDCAGEWVCDPVAKTCVGQEYVEPGGACDTDIRWCWIGVCDMADGATTGVCPIVLPDGSACDPNDRARTCDSFASCFQGTCQIVDANACG